MCNDIQSVIYISQKRKQIKRYFIKMDNRKQVVHQSLTTKDQSINLFLLWKLNYIAYIYSNIFTIQIIYSNVTKLNLFLYLTSLCWTGCAGRGTVVVAAGSGVITLTCVVGVTAVTGIVAAVTATVGLSWFCYIIL